MKSPVQPVSRKNSAIRQSSRKPPAIRNEVVARRIAGQCKAKIADEMDMSVNTVSSIIELSDVDRLMESGRLGTMQRVSEALKTLDVRLDKHSESAALWVLDKCFDGNETRGNRMSNDVFLQQTLNVLLHDGEPAKVDSETRTVEQAAIASDEPQDK